MDTQLGFNNAGALTHKSDIRCPEDYETYATNKENGEENSWKTQIPKDFR